MAETPAKIGPNRSASKRSATRKNTDPSPSTQAGLGGFPCERVQLLCDHDNGAVLAHAVTRTHPEHTPVFEAGHVQERAVFGNRFGGSRFHYLASRTGDRSA